VLLAESEPDIALGLDLLFTESRHRTHLIVTGPDASPRSRRPRRPVGQSPTLPDEAGRNEDVYQPHLMGL